VPNQFKAMVGTAGLALLLGCGEKQTEVAAPVAEEIGQPAVEQEFIPLNEAAGVAEANEEPLANGSADITRAKKFRASDSLDVEAFREQVNLEIAKKDKEG